MDRTTHLLDQDASTPCHVSDTSHMSQPMKISQTIIGSHFPRQPTATRRLLSTESAQGQDSSRVAMVYRLYPAQCVLRTTLRLRRTTRILWMTWSKTYVGAYRGSLESQPAKIYIIINIHMSVFTEVL